MLLTTINASYIHASVGLRYLYANLNDLQSRSHIMEFTSHLRAADIVEKILEVNPKIIGFGVYIWNTEHTTKVISLLKIIAPEIIIIIGGPEVSYEYEQQTIFKLCDYLIPGAADCAFASLCQEVLDNKTNDKVYHFNEPALNALHLPYQYYTDEDINNRVLYVEASRGCPFKCEFCLSALDKTSLPFDIDVFLIEMEQLYQRGARNFKFVDRTFNLKVDTSLKILNFFLARIDDDLFLHFEIISDRLPDSLKETIARFPSGSLQFEVGVQSFNPQVQELISRKQDNKKTIENMLWLRNHSRAHIHADLIFGLPGEDLDSFAQGFNQLYQLKPQDIQLGILKRLRGTPVIRHTRNFQLKFETSAPYSILATDCVDFQLVQRMIRFARYWELIANSGHFGNTLTLLLADKTFQRFLIFSDWLYKYSGKTHQISLRKLYDYLYYGLNTCFEIPATLISTLLLEDYKSAGLKGKPEFYKMLGH
ncbi:MAG: radical SAM protein [gamma proteobacterium symbiont of Bathyaustriella thionipta]|nr:radical SAM protein [gamma proteobacterium symbiont of Bathyaustriella thionipta]MCU7950275.1 radical SAM protein [gamma proteobacterium symbiont of Bathyaustriella thionipta]MCU7952345.1 radical SAM protein [gamma proteobacterium symbiont of Bathyaustriella thionipta]MCU7956792.1 radical SAM protein [gamma proteobacterium symbiont of Bathyaustriella thionipta]MCU7968307.1 radical SAM protein [gamma proteobacterium symbiont of Bathyaustriella thionipta]